MSVKYIPRGDLSYLGKEVSVTVDRPIGAHHPKHDEIIYPINYGYVRKLVGGDGEEQDVYILGSDKPIKKASVFIIAVIERLDDSEDKWVGVPRKLLGEPICYECNLRRAIDFQEQFYSSICHPLYEKTCGAVMYTEKDGERKYLIIKNDSGHIGFPKGHVEYGESEYETAVREVREETGLAAEPCSDFRMEYTYVTQNNRNKTAVYFLSHYDYSIAEIQHEEIDDSWLLNYDEAMKLLNFEQDRVILKAAEKKLSAK